MNKARYIVKTIDGNRYLCDKHFHSAIGELIGNVPHGSDVNCDDCREYRINS